MDKLYHLHPTSYGGRCIIATQAIPKDTLLHTCRAPYASVIQHDFRKEVCAECFAYSFDVYRNTWNVRSEAGIGVWFCGEACRMIWEREENVDGIISSVNLAIEKAITRMRKNKLKVVVVETLAVADYCDIAPETLNGIWETAELWNPMGKSEVDIVYLNDFELEIARFVASAIVKRYIEDSSTTEAAHRWSDYLELQDNELLHVRARPCILDSHLRVYKFLRCLLPSALQVYVVSSETVRAALSRDAGNAFGVWQLSPTTDDGEMFGWGIYVSGSYFNHSCVPNVRKGRVNRAMTFYTTRDVKKGEELCINYVSVGDDVLERRRCLQENWYFQCVCEKCQKETDGFGEGDGR